MKEYIVITKERMMELYYKAQEGDRLDVILKGIIDDPLQKNYKVKNGTVSQ